MESLRFTPYAYAKMIFLRDHGKTEVSFMAISNQNDVFLVENVLMVPQECSVAYTEFKDNGLADFYDRMVDDGYEIERFGRIWCHTHPGPSAHPSGTDENTFREQFGNCDWAIMFILGTTGNTTCRLQYKNAPVSKRFATENIKKELNVCVDYKALFPSVNEQVRKSWIAEYDANWSERVYANPMTTNGTYGGNWQTKKDAEKEHPFGPGWRRTTRGTWIHTSADEKVDREAGLKVSRDWDAYMEERRKRDESFRTLGETRKSPIGFYQGGQGSPQTNNNGKLTKRERKYLRKNGSLKGFVPPVNTGAKSKMVKAEKLDASRSVLTEQSDDEYFDWLEDAQDAVKGQRLFNITLDPKFGGARYRGVPGTDEIDALQKVHKFCGLPPFIGNLLLTDHGKSVYIPGPEDLLEGEDTELEPTDEELTLLELAEKDEEYDRDVETQLVKLESQLNRDLSDEELDNVLCLTPSELKRMVDALERDDNAQAETTTLGAKDKALTMFKSDADESNEAVFVPPPGATTSSLVLADPPHDWNSVT